MSAGIAPMWAVTSYYNPARYKRRLTNYKAFRKNLGIPLVTVELSFNGHFDLTENDADILIQISSGAVLWQKERLLNVAIESVPPNVGKIAWLDCDVLFERPDWVDAARKQLDTSNVVQLFSDLIYLNPEGHQFTVDSHDALPSSRGVVSSLVEKQSDFASLIAREQPGQNVGRAWAARREVLENHGLFDAMIIGAGDWALAAAIYGQFENMISVFQLNSARAENYLKWARPYQQAVGEAVGYVPGRIYHLWHGTVANRHYRERHGRFAQFKFEPDLDLSIGSTGAWQWARSRPDLEEFFANYFANRAEDG